MPDTTTLDQLVRETIDITGNAPPAVMESDAPSLAPREISSDENGFYLVGLIGGKEVGKSSLVNALVGQPITEQTSHGPGTETVIAYTHESQKAALQQLLQREVPGRFTIVTHRIAHLSRQVLLDLPDIDSRFAEHLEITRTMLRHMLFPIWIQSVEKYADLQPQKLLSQVAAGNDPRNFIFVLNKADQLLAREGPAALRELRDDFASRIGRTLGIDAPAVHVISATHPDDHDLPALRKKLSQQRSTEAVQESRHLAGRRRQDSLLRWLDDQQLPERAQRLARLETDAQELVAIRIGTPLLEQSVAGLMDDPVHRGRIIDQVMRQRIARWPIVNIIDTLLSPLLGGVRAMLTPSERTPLRSNEAIIDAYLSPPGRPMSERIRATFAYLQQSHPAMVLLYRHNRLWEEAPADVATTALRESFALTLDRQRTAAGERISGRYGVVAPLFRWLLTIGALLWFPIVQPLLEASLQPGAQRTARDLLLLGVQLLGTTYLLTNLSFLLLYFLVLWLILRWSTQRRVQRLLLKWKTTAAYDPSLSLAATATQWLDVLVDPIRNERRRIERIVQSIQTVRDERTAA